MQTQNVLNMATKNRVHYPRRPNANKLKTMTKYNQIHHDSDKIITYIHHIQKSNIPNRMQLDQIKYDITYSSNNKNKLVHIQNYLIYAPLSKTSNPNQSTHPFL